MSLNGHSYLIIDEDILINSNRKEQQITIKKNADQHLLFPPITLMVKESIDILPLNHFKMVAIKQLSFPQQHLNLPVLCNGHSKKISTILHMPTHDIIASLSDRRPLSGRGRVSIKIIVY